MWFIWGQRDGAGSESPPRLDGEMPPTSLSPLSFLCRSTSSALRAATIWHVRSATLTSATAVESATDIYGLWSSALFLSLWLFSSVYLLILVHLECSRFFGDHTSNLSVFGCKFRYLPDKPHLRRLVRGSVCGKMLPVCVGVENILYL